MSISNSVFSDYVQGNRAQYQGDQGSLYLYGYNYRSNLCNNYIQFGNSGFALAMVGASTFSSVATAPTQATDYTNLYSPGANLNPMRGLGSSQFSRRVVTTAASSGVKVVFAGTGVNLQNDEFASTVVAGVAGGDAIVQVAVTAGGSGYTTAPAVSFSGGGGLSAAATAVVTNGVVTSVLITTLGSGYTTAPTVVFTGSGTGATATAALGVSLIVKLRSSAGNEVVYTTALPNTQAFQKLIWRPGIGPADPKVTKTGAPVLSTIIELEYTTNSGVTFDIYSFCTAQAQIHIPGEPFMHSFGCINDVAFSRNLTTAEITCGNAVAGLLATANKPKYEVTADEQNAFFDALCVGSLPKYRSISIPTKLSAFTIPANGQLVLSSNISSISKIKANRRNLNVSLNANPDNGTVNFNPTTGVLTFGTNQADSTNNFAGYSNAVETTNPLYMTIEYDSVQNVPVWELKQSSLGFNVFCNFKFGSKIVQFVAVVTKESLAGKDGNDQPKYLIQPLQFNDNIMTEGYIG